MSHFTPFRTVPMNFGGKRDLKGKRRKKFVSVKMQLKKEIISLNEQQEMANLLQSKLQSLDQKLRMYKDEKDQN